ncbi:MAG TPA: ACP S-malonyltransferase, partial [bacterium]|nr:ACP S-malonyltransferase [bacterium]
KIGIIFPGQGSQFVGMGKDFQEDERSQQIFQSGEEITGLPLEQLAGNGPESELTRTIVCQPAILATDLVCWEMIRPYLSGEVHLAGHSLGEYAALVASGALSLEDGFRLVWARARAMQEAASKTEGGMLAVQGKSREEVENLILDFPGVEVSNINAPLQIVVGGPLEKISSLEEHLRKEKVKAVRLRVSGAFHTSLMKEASAVLKEVLGQIEVKPPRHPVYLNYSGRQAESPGEIKEALVRQIYSPVRWVEIIRAMARAEVSLFVEAGPRTVLSNLVQKIIPGSQTLNVRDRESLESTRERLEKMAAN